MTKGEAIEKLEALYKEMTNGSAFSGRAQTLRAIRRLTESLSNRR